MVAIQSPAALRRLAVMLWNYGYDQLKDHVASSQFEIAHAALKTVAYSIPPVHEFRATIQSMLREMGPKPNLMSSSVNDYVIKTEQHDANAWREEITDKVQTYLEEILKG